MLLFNSYWISPSVSPAPIKLLLGRLDQKLKQSKKPFVNSLLIIPENEIMNHLGSNSFYITEKGISDAVQNNLSLGEIFARSRQIASLIFRKSKIEISGFEPTEKVRIMKKMLVLGYNPKISNPHEKIVVAGKSMTAKVIKAAEELNPVVTKDWVSACLRKNVFLPFDQFLLPPFFKLIITSTDLTSHQRTNLSNIVKDNGGVWSEVFDHTVDCVISQALNRTQKNTLALKSNVPVVKPEWIIKKQISPVKYVLNWWCLSDEKRNLFDLISFDVDSELIDQKEIQTAIIANGGRLSSYNPDYSIKNDGDQPSAGNSVSARWFWKCVTEQKIIDENSSPIFRPFHFQCPIEELCSRSIGIIGFDDAYRLELSEIMRELGAKVTFSFSKDSYFVVASKVSTKLNGQCNNYGVPIVNPNYVSEIIKNGKLPEFYSEQGSSLYKDNVEIVDNDTPSSPVERPLNYKVNNNNFTISSIQKPAKKSSLDDPFLSILTEFS